MTAIDKVFQLMSDGEWRTLAAIAKHCECSEPGASARLRDLRKEKYGWYTIEKRRLTKSLWEYRISSD